MQKLFDLPATMPARNPLTRCDKCGKSYGTLPCPADWCCPCNTPEVFLMVLMSDGRTECARCFHQQLADSGTTWAQEMTWIDALRHYLESMGVK